VKKLVAQVVDVLFKKKREAEIWPPMWRDSICWYCRETEEYILCLDVYIKYEGKTYLIKDIKEEIIYPDYNGRIRITATRFFRTRIIEGFKKDLYKKIKRF